MNQSPQARLGFRIFVRMRASFAGVRKVRRLTGSFVLPMVSLKKVDLKGIFNPPDPLRIMKNRILYCTNNSPRRVDKKMHMEKTSANGLAALVDATRREHDAARRKRPRCARRRYASRARRCASQTTSLRSSTLRVANGLAALVDATC